MWRKDFQRAGFFQMRIVLGVLVFVLGILGIVFGLVLILRFVLGLVFGDGLEDVAVLGHGGD